MQQGGQQQQHYSKAAAYTVSALSSRDTSNKLKLEMSRARKKGCASFHIPCHSECETPILKPRG